MNPKGEFIQTYYYSDFIANLQSRIIYCHHLEMLKLRKNKRNDLHIFFAHRDVRNLTCLSAKFQEDEKSPGEVMVYDKHSSFRVW